MREGHLEAERTPFSDSQGKTTDSEESAGRGAWQPLWLQSPSSGTHALPHYSDAVTLAWRHEDIDSTTSPPTPNLCGGHNHSNDARIDGAPSQFLSARPRNPGRISFDPHSAKKIRGVPYHRRVGFSRREVDITPSTTKVTSWNGTSDPSILASRGMHATLPARKHPAPRGP